MQHIRHEFRFRQIAPDGRCFIDLPASADLVRDEDCPFGSVYLNGAMITGPLLEAVEEYMEQAGIIDAMRALLPASD